MSLIGPGCKHSDVFSLRVLIGRGLFLLLQFKVLSQNIALFFVRFLVKIGAYGSEVTPVPIPNTEVKLIRVDDTWLATARETKSVPVQKSFLETESFFYCLQIV